jgi:hypothetical protein
VQGERISWSTITLARWPIPLRGRTSPAWRISIRADEGAFIGDFYRAVLHGCCDQTDVYYLLNPRDGHVVFAHSREEPDSDSSLPAIHHWPSQSWRYIAFHDRYTPADPPETRADTQIVGVLQYGPVEGPIARIALRRLSGRAVDFRLDQLLLRTTNWTGRDLELPNTPPYARLPAAFGGFAVRVQLFSMELDTTVVVDIPVVRDQLQLNRASVPQGFALRAIR